MNIATEALRLFKLDGYNYPKFRAKIIRLYLHAFTTGEYAQYVEPQNAESSMDELMRKGFGSMAFIEDILVGVVLAVPLSQDSDFPEEARERLPMHTSLYIAEVMVDADFRGRGIASRLLQNILESVSSNYSDVVIRVWSENQPALCLYEKMGFKAIGCINQTKYRSAQEPFEMRKIYLHKKIERSF